MRGMAMGKRKRTAAGLMDGSDGFRDGRQSPFYARLNRLLGEHRLRVIKTIRR
jgi:hypothetical protein